MKNTRRLLFVLAGVLAVLAIVVLVGGFDPRGVGAGGGDRRDDVAKSGGRGAGDDDGGSEVRGGGAGAGVAGGTPSTGADHRDSGAGLDARTTETPDRSGGAAPIVDDHDGTAGSGKQARTTVTVVFRGEAPAPRKVKMTPECGGGVYLDREVLVRDDGALANVVVSVLDGVPLGGLGSGIGAEVVQEGCEYVPRVSVMQAGQDVQITSRDHFLHNVHSFAGDRSLFNKGQPGPGSFVKEALDFPVVEDAIRFTCDVHPWMNARVFVSRSPYFGMTGESGTVTLLTPPGELTLRAWHETLGEKRQTLRVTADEPATVTFEFP